MAIERCRVKLAMNMLVILTFLLGIMTPDTCPAAPSNIAGLGWSTAVGEEKQHVKRACRSLKWRGQTARQPISPEVPTVAQSTNNADHASQVVLFAEGRRADVHGIPGSPWSFIPTSFFVLELTSRIRICKQLGDQLSISVPL